MGAMSMPKFDLTGMSKTLTPMVRDAAKAAGIKIPGSKTKKRKKRTKLATLKKAVKAPSADPASVEKDPKYGPETEDVFVEESSGIPTPVIIGGVAAAGLIFMMVMKKKK